MAKPPRNRKSSNVPFLAAATANRPYGLFGPGGGFEERAGGLAMGSRAGGEGVWFAEYSWGVVYHDAEGAAAGWEGEGVDGGGGVVGVGVGEWRMVC